MYLAEFNLERSQDEKTRGFCFKVEINNANFEIFFVNC